MAFISVTNTFTNGTVIDAGQVNTNFTDIINGTSDGTNDFNIAALTAAGTATLSGNVLLGSSSADDIQFNGSLATSIPIKTTNTYNFGGSSTGLASIYIALGASNTVRILGSSSGTPANWTLTIPSTAGSAGQVLLNSGSGTLAWKPGQVDTSAQSGDYTITDTDGVRSVLVTTSSTNRTITLPTAADNSGRIILVKKVDSGTGTVIIDGENSETIDGATTLTLYNQYEWAELHCDGSNWLVIAANISARSMTDAAATRLGLKRYQHGSTYNGSNAPTITLSSGGGSLNSVTGSRFALEQDQDGNWVLEGQFTAVLSSASRGSAVFDIAGISSAAFTQVGCCTIANDAAPSVLIAGSGNTIAVSHATATTTTYSIFFKIVLSAKPNWAY